MKKRILKIAAFCLAVALIIGIFSFADGLVGNPISKLLARHTAKKYLEINFADTDYEIEKISYSFKDGKYYAHIVSPTSMDGHFVLLIAKNGKPVSTDYSSRVENHGNVANRLYFEYREMVDSVLKSYAFPYTVSMGYGSLEFDRERGEEVVEGALDRSNLVNDKFYDVSKLGAKNGELVLYIDDQTVTYEKAAEILLKTKELMDGAGISFYSVDFSLRYPPYDPTESYKRPEGEISIRTFLYTDIYEEGMTERVKQAVEDTKNYYEEQNKLK